MQTAAVADSTEPVAARTPLGTWVLGAYWLVYLAPFPLGSIPGTDAMNEWWERPFLRIVPWFGAHLLRISNPIVRVPTGSGDTLYQWVLMVVQAMLALLLGAAFLAIRPTMRTRTWVAEGVRIYVRYGLGAILAGYGFAKFFQGQFPANGAGRLIEPLGEMSPMGLLWTFMGASPAYNAFAGIMELGGAVLLFWRRTTVLGALCCVAVLSNIVLLNFAYDVPVKLYSLHLLTMAAYLVAPDAKRLFDFFLRHRATRLAEHSLRLERRWTRRGLAAAKALLVGSILLSLAWEAWSSRAPRTGLFRNVYAVERWESGEEAQWVRMGADPRGTGFWATDTRGLLHRYVVKDDPRAQRLSVREFVRSGDIEGGRVVGELTYQQTDPEVLLLTGTLRGATTRIALRMVPDSAFTLRSRGFHWVTEFPFNR